MDIEITCKGCGQKLVMDKSACGMTIVCPACGESLVVPDALQRGNKMRWSLVVLLILLGLAVAASFASVHWKEKAQGGASDVLAGQKIERLREAHRLALVVEEEKKKVAALELEKKELEDRHRERMLNEGKNFPLESANKKAPIVYSESGDLRLYGKIVSDPESIYCVGTTQKDGVEALNTLDSGWKELNDSLVKWMESEVERAAKAAEQKYAKEHQARRFARVSSGIPKDRETQLREVMMAKYVSEHGQIPATQLQYLSPEDQTVYSSIIEADRMDSERHNNEMVQVRNWARDQAADTCLKYRKSFRDKAEVQIEKGVSGGGLIRILQDTRVRVIEIAGNSARIEINEGENAEKVVYVLSKSLLVK